MTPCVSLVHGALPIVCTLQNIQSSHGQVFHVVVAGVGKAQESRVIDKFQKYPVHSAYMVDHNNTLPPRKEYDEYCDTVG